MQVTHEVTIYGASDDLIEVEGDVRDEFYVSEEGGTVLVIGPNGEVVKVRCGLGDVWTATPQTVRGQVGIEQGPRPDGGEHGDMAVTLRFGLADSDMPRPVLVYQLPEDEN